MFAIDLVRTELLVNSIIAAICERVPTWQRSRHFAKWSTASNDCGRFLVFTDPTSVPGYDAERDEFTVHRMHNSELAGMSFADMPDDVRQRILDYEFSVHASSLAGIVRTGDGIA